MNEKELITRIQQLRKFEPEGEWVSLTKGRILAQNEAKESFSIFQQVKFILNHKTVFSGLAIVLFLVGIVGVSQSSMPGDALFRVKKITERSQSIFLSKASKTEFNLKQADKRLNDLLKIAEANDTKNLAPAINEYQATVSKVAENIADEQDRTKVKEIVEEVQKLGVREDKIKSLAVEIGDNIEMDYALVKTIVDYINELESRILTDDEREIIYDIQEDLKNENYEAALIKSLQITD